MSACPTGIAQKAFCALFVAILFFTPFSIAAIEITFPLLLAAWWLGGRKTPAATFPAERKSLWALLFYIAVCGLSISRSKFPTISWTGFIGKTMEYGLLFLLASHAVKYAPVPSRAVRAILIAAWLVLLYSFWQEWAIFRATYKSTVLDPIRGFTLGYVRMVGPYKNPNDLATYLMVVGLLVIALLMEEGRRLPVPLGVLALLLVGCLIWTVSRGAILGFWIGTLLLGALHAHRRKGWMALAGILTASIGFLLFLSRSNWTTLITLSDIGSQDRSVMWNTGWAMFRDRPFLGHGINTFMANYSTYVGGNHWPAYAHNCYLQIAAETGVAGLAVFLSFLFFLGSICRRALRREEASLPPQLRELRPILTGLAAGGLAFLVQSAFDTNLYAVRQAVLFWTLAGMVLGISGLLLKPEQTSQPHP